MATIITVQNKKGLSYRVLVRLKGHPLQSATFKRKTDAEKWAASTESAIREGRHFIKAESKKRSCADLIDKYVKSELPKRPKQIRVQTIQFEWWRAEIGRLSLADLTPAKIAECRDKLSKDRAPATVLRYMAALSVALTWAIKELGWLETSPMTKVRKPSLPKGRTRHLSDDERRRLLDACRASPCKELLPVVVLALSTGMRRSEIMNLYWEVPPKPPDDAWGTVDLKEGRITLHDTKNSEVRVLPIVGRAMELLKGIKRKEDSFRVFPGEDDAPVLIRAHWENALKRAGINDFRFHDLRHSCASYLAMNGASMLEIADVLGHKTLAMVKRYSHLSEAHTTGILTRMNEKIFDDDL